MQQEADMPMRGMGTNFALPLTNLFHGSMELTGVTPQILFGSTIPGHHGSGTGGAP